MSNVTFSLTTSRRDDAEKLLIRANAILVELQEPKDKGTEQFELFESEANEWGIGCLCYYKSAKEHERTLKQLVAEFPEITMWYSESDTETGYDYLAKSNNGKLEKVVLWEVAVSTAGQDDYAQVLAYLKENVETTIWIKKSFPWAMWSYDHLTEEDSVQECLQQLSDHFPGIAFRCVKYDQNAFAYGDEIACYAEFCGNKVEWQDPESHVSEEDKYQLDNTLDNRWIQG